MERSFLMRLMVLCLAIILGTGVYLVARLDQTVGIYGPSEKEYYLSPEQVLFIRPGLDLEILSVTIPPDLRPIVEFTLTDPAGLPLDIDGVFTPGPISVSYIMAHIPAGKLQYTNYSTRLARSSITGDSWEQPDRDRTGTLEEFADGHYSYRWGEPLPADYEVDATHTVGLYARRDLTEFGLDRYVDNVLHHFVPSGSGQPEPRDVVTTATCNARCHDPLALHGGSRREVGLCVLCHTPQNLDPDTGNTLDLKVMVHKIHMGDNLPSGEPYQIIGFGGSVHDYSHVEFPPDIRECEACHTPPPAAAGIETPLVISPNPIPVCDGTGVGSAQVSWSASQATRVEVRIGSPTGKLFARGGGSGSVETSKWIKDRMEFFLVDEATGQMIGKATAHTTVLGCVGTPPGTPRGMAGSHHSAWKQRPSRAACGSCHDDVDFVTGQNHTIGLPQPNDDFCGVCHPPQGREFTTAIPGAHTVPYKSTQLEGLLIQVQDIVDTFPGQKPTVFFSISNKNGKKIAPSSLAFFNLNIAGPTDDYSVLIRESARDAAVPAGNGYYSYTFDGSIPNDAEGTFALGAEGFRNVDLLLGSGESMAFREAAENPVVYFAVTDEAPVPRREVVADYKCEACHLNLQLHGTIRHNPEYCVTCHIPSGTDVDRRPEDAGPPESRHFKYMIHKIHSGEELERGFVIYGFGGSRHDYGHLEFPGDLRNCEKCHVNDSYKLPLPDGLLPTITNWDFFTPTAPIAAACLACHDSQKAAAHADTMTSAIAGEACATCHGEGADFAVERVHSR